MKQVVLAGFGFGCLALTPLAMDASATLAGKPVSTLSLFPQDRAVQEAGGADRVHPADLWEADFDWHDLPAEPGVQPRAADDASRGTMEAIVLRLMRRADPMAWTRLSDLLRDGLASVSQLLLGVGIRHRRCCIVITPGVLGRIGRRIHLIDFDIDIDIGFGVFGVCGHAVRLPGLGLGRLR